MLRNARECGSPRVRCICVRQASGAGDTALAVHFDNLACLAFVIGVASGMSAIMLGLGARTRLGERFMTAAGVITFAGLLLWCTIVFVLRTI